MGILDRLLPPLPGLPPLQPQVEAWVDRSNLLPVLWQDVAGIYPDWLPVTREQAMRVPAVARARHLTCGTIAGLPLKAYRLEAEVSPQPTWAYSTDGQLGDTSDQTRERWQLQPQSPWHRMLWTVDDLLFYPHSLWYATALDSDGRPTAALHVPYTAWDIDPDSGAIVDQDHQPIDTARAIYIPGAHDGILSFGSETITQALDLERNASDVARRPFKLELHDTSLTPLEPDERANLVNEARKALADHDGVLYTNTTLETKDHPLGDTQLMIAGRNAAALNVGRHVSMPAAMLDATTEGASLEYSTLNGRNQQWIDYGLSLYMRPLEARLGMDDVVPRGQRTGFDTLTLTSLDIPTTGNVTED